ncbi:Acyl-coenzyme A oxidase (Acyl-CoA oxidase), partial [Halocaridina rubra]
VTNTEAVDMAVRTDIFCVEDLKKERTKCSFNQEELTNLLDGGKEMTALRRKMCESFFNDPVFTDGTPVDYLSHEERYGNELRKACHALQKLNAENYTI